MTRDELYFKMKEQKCSRPPLLLSAYQRVLNRGLESAKPENLPGAQDGRQRNLFANAPCA